MLASNLLLQAHCDELEKLAKEVRKYKLEIMKNYGARAGIGKTVASPPSNPTNIKDEQSKADSTKLKRVSSGRGQDAFQLEQIRGLEKALRERETRIAEMTKEAERVYNEKKLMGETIARTLSEYH